jgi:hypothetical protein
MFASDLVDRASCMCCIVCVVRVRVFLVLLFVVVVEACYVSACPSGPRG